MQVKKHGRLLFSGKKEWTFNLVGWLKTVFKGRGHEGKAAKDTAWQKNCQPPRRTPRAAGHSRRSATHVNLPLWKKKKKIIPLFARINILPINLRYVIPESSFDGVRKSRSSLFNLFSEPHCGGFLPVLSPLWQPWLRTGERLVQHCARSLFSFEVTALISSVSNC